MGATQNEFTSLSILGSAIADAIDSYGEDSDAVFARAGVSKAFVATPGARIPRRRWLVLLREALEITRDPCFGLTMARHMKPASFHALGMAWLASPSLKVALHVLVRYCKVLSTALSLELIKQNNDCCIEITGPRGIEPPPQMVDFLCASVTFFCRWLHNDTLDPVRIELRHEQLEPVTRYHEVFNAPVVFNAPRDAIHFDRAQLNHSVPAGDPQLAQANETIAARYLESLGMSRVSTRACTALRALLPAGDASIETVAERLCVSVSTLQRQLRAEHTTYRELLDDLRNSMATDYMTDKRIALSEVAFLLGFADQSSFSKAFKRWTGHPPSEHSN